MSTLALMYHDVVDADDDASGFPGRGPASYKLETSQFEAHLDAIAAARSPRAFVLTFDDGGRSAHTHAADALERRGFRGHFFVTTGKIDTPTFVTVDQIRDLARRGHTIGSHSRSHPTRMARLSRDEIFDEWRSSLARLAEILGRPVTVASVPGGYYSRVVAEAAAAAGVKTLFNSEPTARVQVIDGCQVVGRYTILRSTPAADAAKIACGALAPRLRQAAMWSAKKAGKAVAGDLYLRVRAKFFGAKAG